MDMPRIKTVAAGNLELTIVWKTGGRDIIDLAGWIATGGDLLAPLDDPKLFSTAREAEYGAAVAWGSDDSDLLIDAVHLQALAEEQRPFDRRKLTAWQRQAKLSNQEAADFLGVALSTFNSYKAGSTIPTAIGMVCRASGRDPILLQAHFRPRRTGRPRKQAAGTPATLGR
jgi:hypothetical protein